MVNKIIKLRITIVAVFICFLLTSCKKWFWGENDERNIKKQNFTGNQLKTNGYYYTEYSGKNGKFVRIFFYYRNGVLLISYNIKESEITKYEIQFKDGTYYKTVSESENYWGAFVIDGSHIKSEKMLTGSPGEPLKAFIYEGEILNDTTFKITESYRFTKGKKTEESSKNEIWHFKHFRPKPDSTNNFVK